MCKKIRAFFVIKSRVRKYFFSFCTLRKDHIMAHGDVEKPIIHVSKLPDFISWLEQKGYVCYPHKGGYYNHGVVYFVRTPKNVWHHLFEDRYQKENIFAERGILQFLLQEFLEMP